MNAITLIGGKQGELPFSPDFTKRVETLCAHRDKALVLYAQAYDVNQLAHAEKRLSAPFNVYSQGLKDVAGDAGQVVGDTENKTDSKRLEAERAKARDKYMQDVRKQVDSGVWRQIIVETPLMKLMDTAARDSFETDIANNPPEATVDNCLATMRQLVGDADVIFRRGLIEAFRSLDYRYKSNDAFRIKSRFVMSYARSSDKWEKGPGYDRRGLTWNYSRKGASRLMDIERCFHILDGHSQWDAGNLIRQIDDASKRFEYETEGEYMRAKWFKNGNLHVWFTRKDLVLKANKLIAEHFGSHVLADNTHTSNPMEHRGRQKHAVDLGDFQSPPDVARRVIELAEIKKDHRVLEPSAGLGNIALLAAEITEDVVVVEIDANRAAALIHADKFEIVRHADFLDDQHWHQDFDRIVMNPPFAKGAAIRHVHHAFKFLKVGGRLVAVMPSAVKHRDDELHTAFRALIATHDGTIEDLPAGSFKSEGTNVATVIVTITRTSRW